MGAVKAVAEMEVVAWEVAQVEAVTAAGASEVA